MPEASIVGFFSVSDPMAVVMSVTMAPEVNEMSGIKSFHFHLLTNLFVLTIVNYIK